MFIVTDVPTTEVSVESRLINSPVFVRSKKATSWWMIEPNNFSRRLLIIRWPVIKFFYVIKWWIPKVIVNVKQQYLAAIKFGIFTTFWMIIGGFPYIILINSCPNAFSWFTAYGLISYCNFSFDHRSHKIIKYYTSNLLGMVRAMGEYGILDGSRILQFQLLSLTHYFMKSHIIFQWYFE